MNWKIGGALFLVSVTSNAFSEGSNVVLSPVWNYVTSHWGNGTRQQGSLWGVYGGYTYRQSDCLYANVDFTYIAGMLRGSAGNDPTQEYVTKTRFGYTFGALQDRFSLTPFLGIGSDIFHQTLSGVPNFKSYFWYVPIGFVLSYDVTQYLSLGLDGYGAPTFGGRWKVYHSAHALTRTLWSLELPVNYRVASPFSLQFVPFFRQWAYRATGDLIAQRNTYYGLKIAMDYSF